MDDKRLIKKKDKFKYQIKSLLNWYLCMCIYVNILKIKEVGITRGIPMSD